MTCIIDISIISNLIYENKLIKITNWDKVILCVESEIGFIKK